MLKYMLILIIFCGICSKGRSLIVWPIVTILSLIGTGLLSVIFLIGRLFFFPFSMCRWHRRRMFWFRHMFF